MNNVKMTSKTIKSILFASIIAAMILPFSAMNMADASSSQNAETNRIEQKQDSIQENSEKFLKLQTRADNIQGKISHIEDKIKESNDKLKSFETDSKKYDKILKKIKELETKKSNYGTKIESIYEKIDTLQEINYDLFKIPQDKLSKLENAMVKIEKSSLFESKTNSDAIISGMFIDAGKEIIVFIENTDESTTSSLSGSVDGELPMSDAPTNIDYQIESLIGNDVGFLVTGFEEQRKRQVSSPCNRDHERDNFCQPAAGGVKITSGGETPQRKAESSTLSFPATTTNGTKGFVMVAHGLHSRGAEPIGSFVYQPDRHVLGTVMDRHYNPYNVCDCAFIKLSPGRTVANEVIYDSSILLTIDDFISKSKQRVGDRVLMSGKTSNVQWGNIISTNNVGTDWQYADYTAIGGDSGAPVGKVSRGEIDIFGIHQGNSKTGNYEAFVPYNLIKKQLSLR